MKQRSLNHRRYLLATSLNKSLIFEFKFKYKEVCNTNTFTNFAIAIPLIGVTITIGIMTIVNILR